VSGTNHGKFFTVSSFHSIVVISSSLFLSAQSLVCFIGFFYIEQHWMRLLFITSYYVFMHSGFLTFIKIIALAA